MAAEDGDEKSLLRELLEAQRKKDKKESGLDDRERKVEEDIAILKQDRAQERKHGAADRGKGQKISISLLAGGLAKSGNPLLFLLILSIHLYDALVWGFSSAFMAQRISLFTGISVLWIVLFMKPASEEGGFLPVKVGKYILIALGITVMEYLWGYLHTLAIVSFLGPVIVITSPWVIVFWSSLRNERFSGYLKIFYILIIVGYIMISSTPAQARLAALLPETGAADTGTSIDKITGTFSRFGKGISNIFTGRIKKATGEDYFNAYVEENEDQPFVGVALEKLPGSQALLREGNLIKVRARLSATAFSEDSPLKNIGITCTAKQGKDEVIGVSSPETLPLITGSEEQDILCEFDPDNNPLAAGKWDVNFVARFDYPVWSSVKRYFISREHQQELTEQKIDPFTEFAITERIPVSHSTSGPVIVGMGTADSLISIPEEGKEFVIGMTFRKHWTSGKFMGMKDLMLKVPDKFSVRECDYSFKAVDCPSQSLEGCEEGRYSELYAFQKERMGTVPGIDDLNEEATPFTITCTLQAEKSRVLAESPIVTEYFKSVASYTYTIDLKVPVTVKEKLKEEAVVGNPDETAATS